RLHAAAAVIRARVQSVAGYVLRHHAGCSRRPRPSPESIVMRYARYAFEDRVRTGIVEGDRIVELDGEMFGGARRTGTMHAMADVRLLPPVVPPTFYAAGINYLQHVHNAAARGHPVAVPKQANIGYRAANALIGADAAIVIPQDSSGKVQFEGELVVVIGREARNLSRENALSCVFGYTIGNDVSERGWQKSDRTLWRAKNSDTFKPMGPWIETEVDLESLVTSVRLNGREVSRFATNAMIFGIADYISVMTRNLTLHPGDVIWMGTDDPTLDMVAGDVVEVAIEGIGVLRNPVVAG
ncbi:MAG: fumarylacetoacetate hydrolase family protein, partial [Casimicrobiaceae bacterium]